MTEPEVVQFFMKAGYVVKEGDNHIITNKFKRESDVEAPVPEKVIKLLSPKDMFKKFIADSRIPMRAKNGSGGYYMLRQISEKAVRTFFGFIKDKTYEYDDMVAVTKSYYSETKSSRNTLTNYFILGIFEALMDEYVLTKNTGPQPNEIQSSSNRIVL